MSLGIVHTVSSLTSSSSFSNEGRVYPVRVNHYAVTKLPGPEILQWDVKLNTGIELRSTEEDLSKAKRADLQTLRRRIFNEPSVRAKCGRGKFVYNGGSIAWSVGSKMTSLAQDVNYTHVGKQYTAHLDMSPVKTLHIPELQQWLGKGVWSASCIEINTYLDALLAEGPRSKFPINPNANTYFDRSLSHNVFDIGGGVELLRGVFQSVRPSIGCMSVNVDVAHTAFYQPDITVAELLTANLNLSGEQRLANLDDRQLKHSDRLIKGLKVYTKHMKTKDRVMRTQKIFRLLPKQTAASAKFDWEEKQKKVSIVQYYEQNYNIRLRYPNIPLIEMCGQKSITVPAELLYVAAANKFPNALLDGRQTAQIVTNAARPPVERLESIAENIRLLNWTNDETIGNVGMTISPEMMTVQARLLNSPALKFGNSGRNNTVLPRDGKWNIKGQVLLSAKVALARWGVLCLGSRIRNVDGFVRDLVNSAMNLKVNIVTKDPCILDVSPQGNLYANIKNAGSQVGKHFGGKKPQLLIFIVERTPCPEIYGVIKQLCDSEWGIASQVVGANTVAKCKLQTAENILLKVNPKLGGYNHEVQDFLFPRKPTLLLGADVSHPSAGALSDDAASVAALVSNADSKGTLYIGQARSQGPRQEHIEQLHNMVLNATRHYLNTVKINAEKLRTHGFNVIYFRDGVGEHQFTQILEEELPQIRSALKELQLMFATVTVVICQKRHHTRIFPDTPKNGDRNGNVCAGTLLDRGPVHPTDFEFFMVAHCAIKGTARPTKYAVIYDEENWTPSNMHKLAHSLCYSFARSTTSVSLVNVAYYAHLVGARVRAYCKRPGGSTSANYADYLPRLKPEYVFVAAALTIDFRSRCGSCSIMCFAA